MHSRFRLIGSVAILALFVSCGDDSSTTPSDPPRPAVGQHGFTVLSPNGGETFQVAKSMPVRWTASGEGLTGTLRIRLRCGNGEWFDLSENSIPNELGDSVVVLPDSVYSSSSKKMITLPTGSACKVMVQDYSLGDLYDTSDVAFTVNPK